MRSVAVAAMLVVLYVVGVVPSASGQTGPSLTEDFEDDTAGADPSESWYTFSKSGVGTTVEVAGGVGNGGGNALRVLTASTTEAIATFDATGEFDACDSDAVIVEFDFKSVTIGSDANAAGRAFMVQGGGLSGNDQGFGFSKTGATSHDNTAAFAGTTSGNNFGASIGIVGDTWHRIKVVPNCAAGSVQVFRDGAGPFTADAAGSHGGVLDVFRLSAGKMDVGTHELLYDNIEVTLAATPTAPAFLTGTVTDSTGTDREVRLTWPVSSNDTNQDTGDFCYRTSIDTGSGFVDGGTCPGPFNATDGVFEELIGFFPGSGTVSIKIFAENGALVGPYSCTITLNLDQANDADDCGDAGDPPLAPTGLSAQVVDADTDTPTSFGDTSTVELSFPVSENDPDQNQGDFAYEIYINGVFSGDDPTTAQDGEGLRFNSVEITGSAPGQPYSFAVKARNTTTGQVSLLSCTVTVDTSILGDADSCGTGAPGVGGIQFRTPTDTAAGLASFCSDLMGDSEASKFLCGLILVAIVFLGLGAAFAAMAGAPGMPSVIAGSVGAFGMMIFLVVAQLWSLGAAAIIILMSTGVALSLMRRLFFGGGGSSGG